MWQFANDNPGNFTVIAILVIFLGFRLIFLGFRLILEWICHKSLAKQNKETIRQLLEKKKV